HPICLLQVWKFHRSRRKLLRMRCFHLFGIFAFVALLVVVPSRSSQSGTDAAIQNRDTVQRLYGRPVSEVYRTPQGLNVTASLLLPAIFAEHIFDPTTPAESLMRS